MTKLVHVTTVPVTLLFLRGQPQYMGAHGIETTYVSSPGRLLEECAATDGVRSFAVGMERRITPFKDLVAIGRLCRFFLRTRPTIVHAHTPKGGLLGMIAAWLTKVPRRIYHMHGLPLSTATGMRRRILARTERLSCRLATRVLCVSEGIRSQAIELKLTTPGRICVLHNGSISGVDCERFRLDGPKADREALGIPRHAMVIGFVGRIVNDKGMRELAMSWAKIRTMHDAHLVVLGSEEETDPVDPSILCQLKADARVHFVAFSMEVAQYYRMFDLVVLPSYREGFPVVPLEAAACGLPVVATDVPGTREAVLHERTGLLVPPRDPDALASAVLRYLESESFRRQHGAAARRRAETEYVPTAIWAHLLDVYREENR